MNFDEWKQIKLATELWLCNKLNIFNKLFVNPLLKTNLNLHFTNIYSSFLKGESQTDISILITKIESI